MNGQDESRSNAFASHNDSRQSPNNQWPVERINVITIAEVADWLKMSKRNIHRLRSQGKFPAPIKLAGRSCRWLVSDINDWLQEQLRNRE